MLSTRLHKSQRALCARYFRVSVAARRATDVSLLKAETYLSGSSRAVLEEWHNKWTQDRGSVPESWQKYFETLEQGLPASAVHIPRQSRAGGVSSRETATAAAPLMTEQNLKVLALIRSYRVFGHLAADLDPLGLWQRESYPELDFRFYGFGEAELDHQFYIGHEFPNTQNGLMKLRDIIAKLKSIYCGKVGLEYMHIQNPRMKSWLREKMEVHWDAPISTDKKKQIMRWLSNAHHFEMFLANTYKTAKRFGLEGCESLVPGMEALLLRGSEMGLESVVVGMPHRGRLNVLSNIMMKPLTQLFCEFADRHPEKVLGSGDVKYHLGTSTDRILENGKRMHLTLAANPSHLEAVDPVVAGKARAKQYYSNDADRTRTMGIMMHGDAAFAGQGVVAETLELSDLHDYTTGGTVHIIVNNQLGFTTSPKNARSSPYPSDVAKGLQIPVIHVNGDQPELVVKACEMAMEWRQTFKRDVVVDIFCYRRHGHNEMDQPAFTQPAMYARIRQHPPTVQLFAAQLIKENALAQDEMQALEKQYVEHCVGELEKSKVAKLEKSDWLEAYWSGMRAPITLANKKRSGVPVATLKEVGEKTNVLPQEMNAHKNIRKLYEHRLGSIQQGRGIDWATAEALAMGTLLNEGYTVRLSGQDSERGTFSQRHAVVVDQVTEKTCIPLNSVIQRPGQLQIINSSLSEFAVMGFEHGFSLENPNSLVMWEGQFGDFSNGAQVVIDQFISSGEQKWLRQSGLTLLLPHGMEGQGPEHSSARLERYLQMADESQFYDQWRTHANEASARMMQMQEINMQVVYPSTPANFFHLLRRQIHREFRKPLVVMTPKSLLKASYCTSDIGEFADDRFVTDVYPEVDPSLVGDEKIRRVVYCTGKVYYDLVRARDSNSVKNVAIVRIEQLAPFPFLNVRRQAERYSNAEVVWCQEEPENMGAWIHVMPRIENALRETGARRPTYVGRLPAAAPATGSMGKHTRELEAFLRKAIDVDARSDWKPVFSS